MTRARTDNTPLRLEAAAKIAFPDGSMSAASLRRLIATGRLEAERISGRLYVTLADIKEMRKLCRAKTKGHASPSIPEATGSLETEGKTEALAAMNVTAKALSESLQPTSFRSTTGKGRQQG
jgi:hypothetical protein